MKLNPSPTLDTEAPIRERKAALAAETHEAGTNSLITPGQPVDNSEPSPSERLYEAYRLWAFTGR